MRPVHGFFLGASSGGGGGITYDADLTDRTVSLSGSGTITAKYKIDNDGYVKGPSVEVLELWKLSGESNEYELRVTLLSGVTPTGSAIGSWLNCGTDRTWSVSSTSGLVGSSIRVKIRQVGTTTTLATADINIEATSSGGSGSGGGGGDTGGGTNPGDNPDTQPL